MAIPGFAIAGALLSKVLPVVVELILDAISGDEHTAEELRNKSITVSIAFGGGEGDAVKVLREIEADLPPE